MHHTAKHPRPARLAAGLLPLLTLLPACSSGKHTNPSFNLTSTQAKADIRVMQNEPVILVRPVIVLGGWGDVFGVPPGDLARQLRKATGDPRIFATGFGMCHSFDACRERVINLVEKQYPSEDETWTTEVDVIGFSMGGIVARYSAAPIESDAVTTKRLRIKNLYTLSTPHRGSLLASVVAPGNLASNMRPESEFMQELDEHLTNARYQLIPYVRLNDLTVGTVNAAPHDQTPYWLEPPAFTPAHNTTYRDPRIIAELARRLRNETPYTTQPAAAIPEQ